MFLDPQKRLKELQKKQLKKEQKFYGYNTEFTVMRQKF